MVDVGDKLIPILHVLHPLPLRFHLLLNLQRRIKKVILVIGRLAWRHFLAKAHCLKGKIILSPPHYADKVLSHAQGFLILILSKYMIQVLHKSKNLLFVEVVWEYPLLILMLLKEQLHRSLEDEEMSFKLYLEFSSIFGRVVVSVVVFEHFVVVELRVISSVSIGQRLQRAEAMEADVVGVVLVDHESLILIDFLMTVLVMV